MLRRVAARCAVPVLFSIPLCFALGCSIVSESPARGPLGLDGRQASWVVRLFGRPPDMVSVFRPYPGMDTKKMEMDRGEDTALGFAALHCRQADTYFYGDVDRYLEKDDDDYDDGMTVLHGVPPWLDPLRPIKGAADLVYEGQSRSGVRAYHEKTPSKYHVRLFVLPSSTWILSHGAVGDSLARLLAADSSEPPPLDTVPGSFIEQRRHIDEKLRREIADLGWNPELKDLNRLESGGRVVYPIVPGRPLLLGLELVFSDEVAARDSAEEAARDQRFRVKGVVGVERYGTTVVVKMLESTP
jgi:hypothetical protein